MPTTCISERRFWGGLLGGGVIGLGLLWLAAQPFEMVKPRVDAWMPDGSFDLLTPASFALLSGLLRLSGGVLLLLTVAGASRPQMARQWARGARRALCREVRRWRDGLWGLWQAARPAATERSHALGLVVATLLAAANRLPWLNRPMGHDEAYTVMAFARPGWWTALSDYHLPNNHLLNSLLISLILRWGGRQPWMVRLPVFLASLGVVVAVYLVGRDLYAPEVGLGAALALAALPAMREYATNARGYMLVAWFTLLLLWCALQVVRQRNRAAWALLVLWGVLGFFSVPVMLFPWGGVMLWLLWMGSRPAVAERYGSRWGFWLRWALAGGLTAALTLVLYLPAIRFSGADAVFANPFVRPLPWQGYHEVLVTRLRATWRQWTQGLPGWVGLLWLGGIALAWGRHRRIARLQPPFWGVLLLWLGVAVLARRPQAWPRTWYFALPLAVVWGVAGWWGCVRTRRVGVHGLLSVLALAALIGTGRELATASERWHSQGADERAVLLLKDRLSSADILVVDAPDSAPVWYYSLLYGLPPDVLHTDRPFRRAFILVNAREGQTVASVWQARGLQSNDCLPSVHPVDEIGFLQIFECP